MNIEPLSVLSASYVGPSGYGNSRSGFRAWPPELRPAFEKAELADLHWSLLFTSDPARFERMDLMSRLGLMAVELLEAGFESRSAQWRDRTGICVETSTGAIGTDVRFLQTPRASLFTYTLPSTLIGEICIRYRLRGPVLCLVNAPPATAGTLVEAVDWLEQSEADACVCVGCEAVDRACADSLPKGVVDQEWYGCAALVVRQKDLLAGQGSSSLDSRPDLLSLSLSECCRSLASSPKEA